MQGWQGMDLWEGRLELQCILRGEGTLPAAGEPGDARPWGEEVPLRLASAPPYFFPEQTRSQGVRWKCGKPRKAQRQQVRGADRAVGSGPGVERAQE